MRVVVWAIGGIDSSGGAGLTVDAKTCDHFGAICCPILTAIVAQNHDQVVHVQSLTKKQFRKQVDALQATLPPDVIKIGLIKSIAVMQEVIDIIKINSVSVVIDPILQTSSGYCIHSSAEFAFFQKNLLPLATVLTPNISEAQRLTKIICSTSRAINAMGMQLSQQGPREIIIKGGHSATHQAMDFWTNGQNTSWFDASKITIGTARGTGCAFATAIAIRLAVGCDVTAAIPMVKQFMSRILLHSIPLGTAYYLRFNRTSWTRSPQIDVIGFYPIVSDIPQLQQLIAWGVKTIQLRIKAAVSERLIKYACEITKRVKVKLFINDHWSLAIKHSAYGVHLGQEDLFKADLAAIKKAKLRLGISAHTIAEIQTAITIKPSYIAVGALFKSPTKPKRAVLPTEEIKRFFEITSCPLVAIGGINLNNVELLRPHGFAGVAVISAIQTPLLEQEIAQWQRKCQLMSS